MLFGAIALTVLCWGLYGPVLREGQFRMAQSPPSTTTTTVTTAAGAAPVETKAGESTTVTETTAPPKHPALLRPFVCVGFAYFLIGVIVPSVWLHYYGEKGEWTVTGLIWSLAGGALGAIGRSELFWRSNSAGSLCM